MGFSNLPRKEFHFFFSQSVGWEWKAKHDPTGRLIWHITILLFIPPLSRTWGGGGKGVKDHKTEHDKKRFQPLSQVSFAKASRSHRIAFQSVLSRIVFNTSIWCKMHMLREGRRKPRYPLSQHIGRN